MADKARIKETRIRNKRQGSVNRGRMLLDRNRTKPGAIGRGIGRQVAIHAGIAAGVGAVSLLASKGFMNKRFNDESVGGIVALGAMSIAPIIGVTATGHNVYKTARDYRDIGNAKNEGYTRRKDRYVPRR